MQYYSAKLSTVASQQKEWILISKSNKFFVNDESFFLSHRVSLNSAAAKKAGEVFQF